MNFLARPFHISEGAAIQAVDDDLLEAVKHSLAFVLAPAENWWYAESCYQALRNGQWHEVQALSVKLSGDTISLDSQELDLASRVVECADQLQSRSEQRKENTISSISAVAGLAATVVGLLAILN